MGNEGDPGVPWWGNSGGVRESILMISRNRKSESSCFRSNDKDSNCCQSKTDVRCYRIANWGRHAFNGKSGKRGDLSFPKGVSRRFRHKRLEAMCISLVWRRMFRWCNRTFIWNIQVNLWEGFVDSDESFIHEGFLKMFGQEWSCSKAMSRPCHQVGIRTWPISFIWQIGEMKAVLGYMAQWQWY